MNQSNRVEKSDGHVMFLWGFEYFTLDNGDLYRAPADRPVINGIRAGARFEMTAALIESHVEYLQSMAE